MFARWLQEAGQSIVQILPINEMPPIETSPYSAMTAMALDPIYITMAERRRTSPASAASWRSMAPSRPS